MPHIILEYSSNIDQEIDTESVLGRLFKSLAGITGIAIDNCKGRIIEREHFRVGAGGERKAFVHCSIKLLSGRSEELKALLGGTLLAELKEYFAPSSAALDLQITVEFDDIERGSYFKEPPGTLGRG